MTLQPHEFATDPRVGLFRLTFDFLIQQQYFGSEAMGVACGVLIKVYTD